MKPRCKHRFVFFICILLLGEEFARAKSLNEPLDADQLVHENKRIFDYEIDDDDESLDDDDDGDDDDSGESASGVLEDDGLKNYSKRPYLVSQRPVDECSGKKGWINIGSVFKALRIGSKIAGYASSALALAANIAQAVNGCVTFYPDAKVFHDKFLKQSKVAENLGKEADDIQTGSELNQNYVESTTDMFGRIVCKLNEIDTESDTMLQSISPDVQAASQNASLQILDLIEEKNKTLETIKYITVDGLYRTALQNALLISIPALSIALPAGYQLFKYARKRYRQRRVGDIQTDNNVDFELPPASNKKLFKETRFGKWIGTKQARSKQVLINLKRKFNLSFTKIKKVAKAFKGALGIAGGFALAAYQAYEAIKGITDCKKVEDNAKEAYAEAVKATKKIEETLGKIKEHRRSMDLSWSYIRGNLTEDMFIESVTKAKEVMENFATKSDPVKAVVRAMGNFLDTINTTDDHKITFELSRDLYNLSLIKVPFAFICLKNKIDMVNNVKDDCKEGYYSLDNLLQKQRDRVDESQGDADSPKACKDNNGIDYVTDDQIKGAWYKFADSERYHRVCYMNDPTKRESFCKKFREENMSAEEISAFYNNKYSTEAINEVLELLPQEKILPGRLRTPICLLRDKNKTDEEIKALGFLFKDVSLEQIVATKCPDEGCIPNDVLPPRERSNNEDDDE